MRSVPAIAFDYRPSRLLAAALVVMTALAVAAIAFCRLPAMLKLVLASCTLAYSFFALRALLRPKWVRVSSSEAGWIVWDAGGREYPASFVDLTTLRPMLILRLRVGPSAFHCALLPDNSDADVRRRLLLLVHRHSIRVDNGTAPR